MATNKTEFDGGIKADGSSIINDLSVTSNMTVGGNLTVSGSLTYNSTSYANIIPNGNGYFLGDGSNRWGVFGGAANFNADSVFSAVLSTNTLRITGTIPTTPTSGMVWYDGTNFGARSGSNNKVLAYTDGNITGNAATATLATNASALNGYAEASYRDAGNLSAGTLPSGRLSGTYNINISGTATSATTATNATQLGGQASSFYAPINSPTFTGTVNLGSVSPSFIVKKENTTGEGGQIILEKSDISVLNGNLIIDLNGDYIRFFDSGTNTKGAYLPIMSQSNGVGSRIWTSSDFNISNYPTTSGGGASGTWNINITGTAPLATNSTQLNGYQEASYRDASNLSAGTLPSGRLSGTYNINVSGNATTATTATNSTQLGGLGSGSYFVKNATNGDDWLGTRIIRNISSTGGQNDGLYIGYGNTNSGTTKIFSGGSSTVYYHSDASANITKSDGSVYWHSGNDGSGSGLDADLLDGNDSSFFRNASNLNAGAVPTGLLSGTYNIAISGNAATSSNSNALSGYGVGAFARTDSSSFAFRSSASNGYMNFQQGNATNTGYIEFYTAGGIRTGYIGIADGTWNSIISENTRRWNFNDNIHVNGAVVWNSANDGSGSGLDADLLDGNDSSSFRDAGNLSAGILPAARLSGTYSINVSGSAGSAANASALNGHAEASYRDAGNLSAGILPSGRLSGTYNINISGTAAAATTASNSNALGGYALGTNFSSVPYIQSNGVMEIGRYVDFHTTNADGLDYTARIESPSSGELTATANFRVTGDISAYYSDDRLKTKLGAIENALDKVKTLEGFYYEANEIAQELGYMKKREVGVSAQSVQKILPEVVLEAPIDAQYLTVKYDRLVPLLIESIKELSTKIDMLQNKIIDLETK